MFKYIYILLSFICFSFANASSLKVDLNIDDSGDDITINLNLDKVVEYDYFTLSDPYRLVVDLKNTDITLNELQQVKNHYIKDVSSAKLNDNSRVTIEFILPIHLIEANMLKQNSSSYDLSFLVNINQDELYKNNAGSMNEFLDLVLSDEELNKIAADPFKSEPTILTNKIVDKSKSKPVIIIDAGHGGKDPGAVNRNGDKEKNITLEFALELAEKLKKTQKYKVYLTRDNDRFVSLAGRQYFARRKNADLFISLHADSAPSSKASGVSIYTLSDKASDNVAAMLARKANKSDVIAGVDLTGETGDVTDLMIDMSQKKGMEKSKDFANILHDNLKDKIDTVSKAHRYAGFAVLKNSNMASVLVELGFVSNSSDAKKLKSSSYRNKFTKAIKESIDEYFDI